LTEFEDAPFRIDPGFGAANDPGPRATPNTASVNAPTLLPERAPRQRADRRASIRRELQPFWISSRR
jgi:hypothetical protein